jgi:hypothetical protein
MLTHSLTFYHKAVCMTWKHLVLVLLYSRYIVCVVITCNKVVVHNANTCQDCLLETPLWCLDQTAPGYWKEWCCLQEYDSISVMLGRQYSRLATVVLTHSLCGMVPLPGCRMSCHNAAGHRPQVHWLQAGNITFNFDWFLGYFITLFNYRIYMALNKTARWYMVTR